MKNCRKYNVRPREDLQAEYNNLLQMLKIALTIT